MNRNLPKLMSATLLSGLLVACGGGGGGDNSSAPTTNEDVVFTGVSTQAQVTVTNAPELTKTSLSNGTAGATSSAVVGVTTDNNSSSLATHSLSGLFGRVAAQHINLAGASSVIGVIVGPETEACSGGGTVTVTIDLNQSTGSFTGDIELSNCVEQGQTINGAMAFSGSINVNTLEFDSALAMTFTSLGIKGDGANMTLNGRMSCDLRNIDTMLSCTENFDLRDNISGQTFRTENLRVTIMDASGGAQVAISGRFYHPTHGYVEIVTDTSLFVSDNDSWPSVGVIRLLGADGSRARVTVIDASQYTLEVDSDGDTIYESNTVESWSS